MSSTLETRVPASADGDSGAESSDDEAVSSTTTGRESKKRRPSSNKTACELCKLRKVKCDRAEPACGWCAKNKRECVYRERARPGTRMYGPDIEAKVNRLDTMLRLLGRRMEEHIAHDHVQSSVARSDVSSPGSVPPSLPSSRGHIQQQQQAGHQQHHQQQPHRHQQNQSNQQNGMLDLFPVDLGSLPDFTPEAETPSAMQSTTMVGPSPMAEPPRGSTQLQSNPSQSQPSQTPGPSQSSQPANQYYKSAGIVGDAALASDPDLPAPEIVYSLVDLYFKHINTWCPILDRKAAFGAFFGSTVLSEAKRILLHAVIATTLRFYKDPRLTPEQRAQCHRTSKHRVEQYALEHVSLEALEALVILALDVLGTSNGPLGWNLLAMIVRSVIQLNLCTENSVYLAGTVGSELPRTGTIRRVALPRPSSWIEEEGRRRLCWMVYILDRYATVATPFDFMLDDKFLDLVLPCRYDQFSNNIPVETRSLDWSGAAAEAELAAAAAAGHGSSIPATTPSAAAFFCASSPASGCGSRLRINNPENLGSFSYHCEVLRILSRIHNFLKVPLDATSPRAVQAWRATYRALDGQLNSWLHSLPGEYGSISQLCHSDPASRVANWIMLHAAFVTSVIRLHSSTAYPNPAAMVAARGSSCSVLAPNPSAAQRCINAVRSLRDIAGDVRETKGLDLLGAPFAFALWVSARTLIVHAATYDDGVVDDGVMEFLIDTLREMGKFWEVAENYARILSDVVAEGRNGNGEKSFTDMRRCASEIVNTANRPRRSTLEPTTTRHTSSRELDYVDIFDFFNYPNVAPPMPIAIPSPPPPPSMSFGSGSGVGGSLGTPDRSMDFGYETPKAPVDWLNFQPPHD